MRRQERRLSELGRLEYVELEPGGDVEAWIHDFLQLEASGWKGRQGSAFASSEAGRKFFLAVATEAFRRGRLIMLALRLNGRPIAQKFNLLAGAGSFSVKIAYDENYVLFSPGVHLELENIRRLHAKREIQWMDSCAVESHFMIDHLWIDRRTIQTVLVATGKRGGDLVVSFMPLLRWLNRKLARPGKWFDCQARA